MRSNGFLITGTDTGVGKTFVGRGIASALRGRGLRAGVLKPVETGCEWDSDSRTLMPADAEALRQASGTRASIDTICPYRFRTPVAPAVAADMEGSPIEPNQFLATVRSCCDELAASHDIVIVESAGGILVPIAWGLHFGDLARKLDLPVLLVAGSKLGAINHTLLTLDYLKRNGHNVLGCVWNHCQMERSVAVDTNVEAMKKLVDVPLFVLSNASEAGEAHMAMEFEELSAGLLEFLPDAS